MRHLTLALLAVLAFAVDVTAGVTRLRIERRETILNGRPFGAAGPYEKLVGKVDFALDPSRPQNRGIVDLALAPRNAQGLVEFSADFYLLKPIDPARGNGRLFYEAGNRGSKRILPVFQDAANSADPASDAEFGNGALMRQGFTLLWMGWQWDVPEGRMRMEIPIATNNGEPITGWVRGNFIPGANATSALIATVSRRRSVECRTSFAGAGVADRSAAGDRADHVALHGSWHHHARSRLRAWPDLRRRLSGARSARDRGRSRRHPRHRQLLQARDGGPGQSHARHHPRDRLGRVADRAVPSALRL
jgi:hypothetical protein